jgi:inorganic pyrophosphatase
LEADEKEAPFAQISIHRAPYHRRRRRYLACHHRDAAGQPHTYALDPDIGAFVLKETLASGLSWPYDYGFIPQTTGQDDDPLDIIVLMDEPSFPGCVLTARLLGVIGLKKDGVENPRFVSCLVPRAETALSTDGYRSIKDLPKSCYETSKTFSKSIAKRKGTTIELTGCSGVEQAMRSFRSA